MQPVQVAAVKLARIGTSLCWIRRRTGVEPQEEHSHDHAACGKKRERLCLALADPEGEYESDDKAAATQAQEIEERRLRTVILRRERHGSRPTECLPQPCEHRQVGVDANAVDATSAERCEAVLVLAVRRERPVGNRRAAVSRAPTDFASPSY
jgi:hypothetical protein